MSRLNRLANVKNEFQGSYKKVLCVCSAGLLRSPTAALVLSQEPFNYNTRAAGLNKEYALIPVDEALLHWCDEVVCMEPEHEALLSKLTTKPVICLDIPDAFPYRDATLIDAIRNSYTR